jgi:hypothetical protein
VKNLIDAREVRNSFFKVEQIKLDYFQPRIVFVLIEMLEPAGGKIVEHADFFCLRLGEQQVNQVRADEARAAGDDVNGIVRHELQQVFARRGERQ